MTMCQHQPPCPPAGAPDRAAARTLASHPEQGWSLLCNRVVLFDDGGELLPDGTPVEPPGPLGETGIQPARSRSFPVELEIVAAIPRVDLAHRRVHPRVAAQRLSAPAAHRPDGDTAAGRVAVTSDPAAAFQPAGDAGTAVATALAVPAGVYNVGDEWNGSPVADVASEMSALTLDVVGRVLFGADLVAQAPSLAGRSALGSGWRCWERSCRSPGDRKSVV